MLKKILLPVVENEFFPNVNSIYHLSNLKNKSIIGIKTRIKQRTATPYFLSVILFYLITVFSRLDKSPKLTVRFETIFF